jgi:hypothetical protein
MSFSTAVAIALSISAIYSSKASRSSSTDVKGVSVLTSLHCVCDGGSGNIHSG